MLYTGKNITQSDRDTLSKVSIEDIYKLITAPDKDFIDQIRHLRKIKQIAPERYNHFKKSLPYFIGAKFHHDLRSVINFINISYFIIDLDHLSLFQSDAVQLKDLLKNDERLQMVFCSPGEDGLKLVYQLKQPMENSKLFSDFYRLFVKHLVKKFRIEGLADKQTCDVTRVCFLSYDENACFNPDAGLVDPNDYLMKNNLDENTIPDTLETAPTQNIIPTEENTNVLPAEIYQKIRQKLKPNATQKSTSGKNYYVPPQLNLVDEILPSKLSELHPIHLKNAAPIQYGKKYTFGAAQDLAEINIYFGKNGFSIVRSNKKGTHQELTEICYQFLSELVFEDLPQMSRLTFGLDIDNNL